MTPVIQRLADYVAGQTTIKAAPLMQTHEQYHTIFTDHGIAVATIQRPRVADRAGLFTLSDCDGGLIAAYDHNPSHASIVRDMRAMARAGAGLSNLSAAGLESEMKDSADRAERNAAIALDTSKGMGFRSSAYRCMARAAYRAALAQEALAARQVAPAAPDLPSVDSILAMAQEAAPAPRMVDVTPTWAGIMPGLIAVLINGTAEGRAMAEAELMRLAHEVDAANNAGRGRSLSAAVNPEAPQRPSRAEGKAAQPRYDMAAHDLPRGRMASASGGFPLWAFNRAAIEESIDLYTDQAAPFDSVRDFVEYPEARQTIATRQPGGPWVYTNAARPPVDHMRAYDGDSVWADLAPEAEEGRA